ncbi:MAG: GTP 3',8-cyclase MoaA [Candidatus Eisenbacteria bacterium]|uniref:GTP 3',8-cyclase n=1 Tax=Eiseniibacteriota bacterium TaxID=2212470 RepID=A0A948S0R7_UNCEI|nr:GTP 3',8-cyclase MoaA [Candidatus Eisenbacteria bacterium]MBU1948173.1 GTP 3',8-cyclase MoaA [Candidatus Eisenbacteria bacterium]MBU2693223.1 GTP 3',8-cyclase MoaA [Candidatus Eisenbacteria bacterium]
MKDAQGRHIDYLRISLTDLCNFRCVYCMPEGGVEKLSHDQILRREELIAVTQLMVERFGIRKVRITGGEPLIRRGVIDFLREIRCIPDLEDVALTTNGYLLEDLAGDIHDVGVTRLNISLDTLRRDRFQQITRTDGLPKVLRGIEAAIKAGFQPIKLNVVALKETLDEAADFIAFGIEKNIEVRFIELMPFRSEMNASYISNDEVKRAIEKKVSLTKLEDNEASHGPAVRYRVGEGQVPCGFISPVSRPFCTKCNRIRLRGDGKLVPCLKGYTKYDLMPYIRPIFRGDDLAVAIRDLMSNDLKEKCPEHQLHPMSQIGG